MCAGVSEHGRPQLINRKSKCLCSNTTFWKHLLLRVAAGAAALKERDVHRGTKVTGAGWVPPAPRETCRRYPDTLSTRPAWGGRSPTFQKSRQRGAAVCLCVFVCLRCTCTVALANHMLCILLHALEQCNAHYT